MTSKAKLFRCFNAFSAADIVKVCLLLLVGFYISTVSRANPTEDTDPHIGFLMGESDFDVLPKSPGRDYKYLLGAPILEGVTNIQFLPVKIGIIDSGVDTNHPQLKGIVVKQKDFTGEGLQDDLGHGTMVTLITAQTSVTNNQYPMLFSAKVARKNGEIRERDVIRAIEWLTKEDVAVCNLSLGFKGEAKQHKDLCKAIQARMKVPIIMFVAAAGNYGPDVQVYPCCCGSSNIICIGSGTSSRPDAWSGTGQAYYPGKVLMVPRFDYEIWEPMQELAQGNRKGAVLHLKKMAEERNLLSAWLELGILNLREAPPDTHAAIENFKHVIEIENPLKGEGLLCTGDALVIAEQYDKALPFIKQAIEREPSNERFHYALAEVYRGLKRFPEALDELHKAKSLGFQAPQLEREISYVEEQLAHSK